MNVALFPIRGLIVAGFSMSVSSGIKESNGLETAKKKGARGRLSVVLVLPKPQPLAMYWPPLMVITAPVMKAAASDAR